MARKKRRSNRVHDGVGGKGMGAWGSDGVGCVLPVLGLDSMTRDARDG